MKIICKLQVPKLTKTLSLVLFEMNDFEVLKNFIISVYVSMSNKDFFIIDDIDTELKIIISNQCGHVYGLLEEDEIIAIQAIDFSNNDLFKYYTEKVEKNISFCEMGWTMVAPNHRGNNISQILLKKVEDFALKNNSDTIFVATVHPKNKYGLATYCNSGYQKYTQIMHYNKLRLVMFKKAK